MWIITELQQWLKLDWADGMECYHQRRNYDWVGRLRMLDGNRSYLHNNNSRNMAGSEMPINLRLTCQPATRPMGQAKRGPEGPVIAHKLDTGWQGRLHKHIYS